MGAIAGCQAGPFATAKLADNAEVTIQVSGGGTAATMTVLTRSASAQVDANIRVVARNFALGIVLGHGRYRREQDKTPQNRQFTHFPPSSSFDATGTLKHHLEHFVWVQAF